MENLNVDFKQGLYNPDNEHDSCGVGFVVNIKNKKSHTIITQGLTILNNLTHRGAIGADPLAGDGAGILIQLPDKFFRIKAKKLGIQLPACDQYAVATLFLPQNENQRNLCEGIIERVIIAEGQSVLGWRDVPTNNACLGMSVKADEPVIRHVFLSRNSQIKSIDEFERKLFIIRKQIEQQVEKQQPDDPFNFYIVSLSSQTLVYKGMILPKHLTDYYLDLQDKNLQSALALVHQRFSTNTFPKWQLAQPLRYIGHNGEINTIEGNINWMKARRAQLFSPLLARELEKVWPLIDRRNSDSASFDNVLELLVASGFSLAHAMMMMIPEAWDGNDFMTGQLRAFYEYYAGFMEPWDGPAFIAFTNGRQLGAKLDRNGLRPGRYIVTDDDVVIMASEVGVLEIPEEKIVKKSRLQPGKIFLVDLEKGQIIDDEVIKQQLSGQYPYQQWVQQKYIKLEDLPSKIIAMPSAQITLSVRQHALGQTQEDIKFFIEPMALAGQDPIGSMGKAGPLAVLSNQSKRLYDYFKQRFAEVTNPAIDPIRESLVMSMMTIIGPRPNLLDPLSGLKRKQIIANSPILNDTDMQRLYHVHEEYGSDFKPYTLSICYMPGPNFTMEQAIQHMCGQARSSIEQGYNIIILSDKAMDADYVAIPALLATAAIHNDLIRVGLRIQTSLIIETGEACHVHDFCLLGGYGAQAINPYLALETVSAMANDHVGTQLDEKTLNKNYIKAATKGIQKVMSKMGISTYQSYCGAQVFDVVGLNQHFIDQFFPGTRSLLGGIELAEVEQGTLMCHRIAFSENKTNYHALPIGGEFSHRLDGEDHQWTFETLSLLQHAVRSNDYDKYQEYTQLMNQKSRQLMTIRGLLEPEELDQPIPLDEVEPASEIVKRFVTGAMSFGSISIEAHSTIAIAMNRIGGKSNSGEGGEDRRRFTRLKNGDWQRSAVKQVASGRFGVTTDYLVNADQIQIKIAQGAKPGEGGQLPGHKVDRVIAKVRHSTPGVGLISPPPHHDIYSIEDLAQLIYDLKNVNPKAKISVKLVAQAGVGTIAAGVVKCYADHILISGYDGGTGASPLTSILHAGLPWELGLAETQQTLLLNHLRTRVRLQTDGGLKTGRDVLIAALLGADEFCFGTAALITQGCIMMRKCHLNTCPVGVATQDPLLRQHFNGKAEYLVNYFMFIAEEVRAWMAKLGVRRFTDLIGRTELLRKRKAIDHWKSKHLDIAPLLYQPQTNQQGRRYHCEQQNHLLADALDHQLIAQAQGALDQGTPVKIETAIGNEHRSVGTRLSGVVAQRYGAQGLPDSMIHIKSYGSAGQSFGAFLAAGITLEHIGDTNDYVGKGLSGGRIIIYPSEDSRCDPKETIIAGNTLLYGATSGEIFINGVVGERFAVRNSGAVAVVEGVGEHGCEYMTGGIVLVLGEIGKNFAAGMSGGIAYVIDGAQSVEQKCNMQSVSLAHVQGKQTDEPEVLNDEQFFHELLLHDEQRIKHLIKRHIQYTNSQHAIKVLKDWNAYRSQIIKIIPNDFRAALEKMNTRRQVIQPMGNLLTEG